MPTQSEQSSVVPYARALWARRWVVVAVTALFAVVGLGYILVSTKAYTATARLLLEASLPTALLTANGSNAYQGPVNAVDAAQVITSGAVAKLVQAKIGSAPAVTAVEVGTSDVLDVSVTDTNPRLAQRAADAYVTSYISYVNQETNASLLRASQVLKKELSSVEAAVASFGAEVTSGAGGNPGVQAEAATAQAALQSEETGLENQLATYQTLAGAQGEGGQLISAATLPGSPSSPNTARNVAVALIAGLVVGALAALALQYRDDVASRQRGAPLTNGTAPVRGRASAVPEARTSAAGGVAGRVEALATTQWATTSKGGIR